MKRIYLTLTLLLSTWTIYGQAILEPDYLLLGRDSLPQENEAVTGNLFFFEASKGALRGGRLGESFNWAPDSIGSYSIAYGFGAKATSTASVAFGTYTTASGSNGSIASGDASIASGSYGSTALGFQTTASANFGSTALGYQTTASGRYGATAIGDGTIASGEGGATAIGGSTTAMGDDGSTALGYHTVSSGYGGTTAFGYFTSASGDEGATALGSRTKANGDHCLAVGMFNDPIVSPGANITPGSPLFIIGNGEFGVGNESNALVVHKNGVVSFENYSFPDLDGSMGQVLGTNGSGNLDWMDSGDDWTNNASDIFRSTGSVVIGNTVIPAAKLEVNNPISTIPAAIFENAQSISNVEALKAKTLGTWRASVFEIDNTANSAAAIYGTTNGTGTGLVINHTGSTIGNLAIFQSSNNNMVRIDRTGKGFFNGGTQNSGADIAEAMKPEGDIQDYDCGDVLVISVDSDRSVEKSSQPYSSLVAGVYATKPGVVLTEEHIEQDLSGHVPMGVIGIIPTKVCDEGGPIKRGDILVTSSRSGYAMKADHDKLKIGQALGKALQNSEENTDVINVLVNIQ